MQSSSSQIKSFAGSSNKNKACPSIKSPSHPLLFLIWRFHDSVCGRRLQNSSDLFRSFTALLFSLIVYKYLDCDVPFCDLRPRNRISFVSILLVEDVYLNKIKPSEREVLNLQQRVFLAQHKWTCNLHER